MTAAVRVWPGGLYALAGVTDQNKNSERYMEIGADITNTCHESYDRTATKLGPENFRFVLLPQGALSFCQSPASARFCTYNIATHISISLFYGYVRYAEDV